MKIIHSEQMYIQVIQDLSFLSLLEEFTSILPYTVHQLPEWYQAYVDAFQTNIFCLLVTDRRSDQIIGLLPLQVQEYRGTRFWNLRRLVPLAYGPSDFVNLLVKPSKEVEFGNAVAMWLRLNLQLWEEFFIPYIPKISPAWQPLVQALEMYGFHVEVDNRYGFWEVDTKGDWDSFFHSFFYQNNKDLLKDIRKLQREKIYLHIVSVQSNISQQLYKLLPLYRQRRETRGEWYKYDDHRYFQFLINVIQAYESFNAVELSILEDDNETPWAYQLDWIDKGVRYHWMHAYNEQFKKYSPGKILLYELLKKSFQDPNIKKCNFMRGEADYKKKLANIRQEYVYIRIRNQWSFRNHITRIASWIVKIRDKTLGRFR